MKTYAFDSSSPERGVYRVHPDGPNGEAVLLVVDSRGHRIRMTCELEPAEVPAVTASLRAWLDQQDPVEEPRSILHVI